MVTISKKMSLNLFYKIPFSWFFNLNNILIQKFCGKGNASFQKINYLKSTLMSKVKNIGTIKVNG